MKIRRAKPLMFIASLLHRHFAGCVFGHLPLSLTFWAGLSVWNIHLRSAGFIFLFRFWIARPLGHDRQPILALDNSLDLELTLGVRSSNLVTALYDGGIFGRAMEFYEGVRKRLVIVVQNRSADSDSLFGEVSFAGSS